MSLYLKGKKVLISLNNALAIICNDKDGKESNVQKELDNVQKEIKNLQENPVVDLPFQFGIDENGNYGYIKEGADSVTPFKTGYNIESPLYKADMVTAFTLNNCVVGKEYIVIYAPWSGGGYSQAQTYLTISSYSGCEAPVTLYSGNDTHHSVYRFYKIKATSTTITIQWHTSGGGPVFVFGQ